MSHELLNRPLRVPTVWPVDRLGDGRDGGRLLRPVFGLAVRVPVGQVAGMLARRGIARQAGRLPGDCGVGGAGPAAAGAWSPP
jgi:hypothetical protein